MLLYFGVSGFLSFRDWQEMFFVPVTGARIKGTKYEHNFHLEKKNRPMKSALLFGDNASGKTNWLYALHRFVTIVRNGLQVDSLRSFHYSSPIVQFKITTISDDENEYEYFLKYNREGEVLEEYLLQNERKVFSFSNENLWLSKSIDKHKQIEQLFSQRSTDTLLNKLKDWANQSIDDFKRSAAQILVEVDDQIYPELKFKPMPLLRANDYGILKDHSDDVLAILQFVDPTIKDINFESQIDTNGDIYYQLYVERLDGAKSQQFAIENESQGIKKMIRLLPQLLQIHLGMTVVIDELDSSIGAKSLIRIFNKIINSPNNRNGQLIASSHNLSLLSLDLFHESQLQIFSKRNDLGSAVHAIDEYDYRAEKKNLDEIYLKGGFES